MHKRDLHQIHFQAWKQGVKSLYYCRSMSIQRAESSVSAAAASPDIIESVRSPQLPLGSGEASNPTNYEECLSCQEAGRLPPGLERPAAATRRGPRFCGAIFM